MAAPAAQMEDDGTSGQTFSMHNVRGGRAGGPLPAGVWGGGPAPRGRVWAMDDGRAAAQSSILQFADPAPPAARRAQTNPTTLSRFIMEEEGRDGGTRADLAFILNSISVASKVGSSYYWPAGQGVKARPRRRADPRARARR
jgi:hypothetical protein